MMEATDIKYIVIHCSATKADMDVDAHTIDKWHKQRGFTKIGYHYVIKRDGRVEKGRELTEAGAHARGFNTNSWSVCLIGGLDDEGKSQDNFTDIQYIVLEDVVAWLKQLAPEAEVLGHRDLPRVHKDCPCFDVREWYTGVKTNET